MIYCSMTILRHKLWIVVSSLISLATVTIFALCRKNIFRTMHKDGMLPRSHWPSDIMLFVNGVRVPDKIVTIIVVAVIVAAILVLVFLLRIALRSCAPN
jgi:hypothetical protein